MRPERLRLVNRFPTLVSFFTAIFIRGWRRFSGIIQGQELLGRLFELPYMFRLAKSFLLSRRRTSDFSNSDLALDLSGPFPANYREFLGSCLLIQFPLLIGVFQVQRNIVT